MRSFREIIQDFEDALGRSLTIAEIDRCYIAKITGAWGWVQPPETQTSFEASEGLHHSHSSRAHKRPREDVDMAYYIAKTGDPIQWQAVSADYAGRHIGILFQPNRTDGKLCAAQFVGGRRYRVYMTLDQAQQVIYRMANNESLLQAVENCLEIPLTPLEKKLIASIMRNALK